MMMNDDKFFSSGAFRNSFWSVSEYNFTFYLSNDYRKAQQLLNDLKTDLVIIVHSNIQYNNIINII